MTEPLTLKRTTMSGVALPKTSWTVAVTVWLVPTGFVSVVGSSTTLAGGPGVHVFVAAPSGSSGSSFVPSSSVSANAVIASVPVVVGPV